VIKKEDLGERQLLQLVAEEREVYVSKWVNDHHHGAMNAMEVEDFLRNANRDALDLLKEVKAQTSWRRQAISNNTVQQEICLNKAYPAEREGDNKNDSHLGLTKETKANASDNELATSKDEATKAEIRLNTSKPAECERASKNIVPKVTKTDAPDAPDGGQSANKFNAVQADLLQEQLVQEKLQDIKSAKEGVNLNFEDQEPITQKRCCRRVAEVDSDEKERKHRRKQIYNAKQLLYKQLIEEQKEHNNQMSSTKDKAKALHGDHHNTVTFYLIYTFLCFYWGFLFLYFVDVVLVSIKIVLLK